MLFEMEASRGRKNLTIENGPYTPTQQVFHTVHTFRSVTNFFSRSVLRLYFWFSCPVSDSHVLGRCTVLAHEAWNWFNQWLEDCISVQLFSHCIIGDDFAIMTKTSLSFALAFSTSVPLLRGCCSTDTLPLMYQIQSNISTPPFSHTHTFWSLVAFLKKIYK